MRANKFLAAFLALCLFCAPAYAAVAADAVTDDLRRTADLPSEDPLSVSLWMYITTDTNAFSAIWVLTQGSGATYDTFNLNSDGTTLRNNASGTAVNGTNLSTATWYHVGYVRNGSSHVVYLNGSSDISNSVANAVTQEAMLLMSNTANYLNGRVAAVKIWTDDLTQAEIQNEMWTYTPKRTADIHIWSPFIDNSTSSFIDYSGAGRNWTETGSVLFQDGPPISWS